MAQQAQQRQPMPYVRADLEAAARRGAQGAQRIWTAPQGAISSYHDIYPVVATNSPNVYSGPTRPSRDPQALQRLQWGELGMWGPSIPAAGDARSAVAQMELSVAADDTIGGDNTYGFSGNPGTFGIAYFPVVYRFTNSGSITQASNTNVRDVHVVPFAVIASAEPWTGAYFGMQPQYVPLRTPDPAVSLQLDVNFCKNDTNLVLSVMASVLSFLPGRWAGGVAQGANVQCYLTIAPALSEQHAAAFHQAACTFVGEDPNVVNLRQSMAFGGASLGLAVAAAICGLPPMLYTGYLSSMGMDQVFYGQKTSSDALKAGININALSQVILGATFVESVDDVPYKVNYAISSGMPIVIPLNPTWTHAQQVPGLSAWRAAQKAAAGNANTATRQESLVRQALAASGLDMQALSAATRANFAATMSDYIMTVSKLAGGKSFLEVGSLVMAASNYADARMLSCKYAGYCYGNYNTNPEAGRPQYRQQAATIALRLESKGLLQSAVQRDVNYEMTRQKKVARAAGTPFPKKTVKKGAENTWMAERKVAQKVAAKASSAASRAVYSDPLVVAALAAARAKRTPAAKPGAKQPGGKSGGAYKAGGKVSAKAAGKVSARAAGKIKGEAAGLMRASRGSRMKFLEPFADPDGYNFVARTAEQPTLQGLRFKTMADARRQAAAQQFAQQQGAAFMAGTGMGSAPPPMPGAVGGSFYTADAAPPAASSATAADALMSAGIDRYGAPRSGLSRAIASRREPVPLLGSALSSDEEDLLLGRTRVRPSGGGPGSPGGAPSFGVGDAEMERLFGPLR